VWEMISKTFLETVRITFIVTILMIIIEFFELRYKDKIREAITESPLKQYLISSIMGAIPGCIGAFFIVSLYVHGLVGIGALAAVMLSTAGDEAFIMLTMIPRESLLIFGICIIVGIVGGFLTDKIAGFIKLKTCQPCVIEFHEEKLTLKHFLKEHVSNHVIKRHVPKLFLWLFSTMLAVDFLMVTFDVEKIIPQNKLLLIILAALIGIIPESGPHLAFTILFSKGLIPFSVLLVNTISQDGHGLLPLISYSVKDTVYVQIFTTLVALIVGIVLFLIGL